MLWAARGIERWRNGGRELRCCALRAVRDAGWSWGRGGDRGRGGAGGDKDGGRCVGHFLVKRAKFVSCCVKREREREKKSRTDVVISFLETAVEIIDMVVVCGIVDVELERVDADDGS